MVLFNWQQLRCEKFSILSEIIGNNCFYPKLAASCVKSQTFKNIPGENLFTHPNLFCTQHAYDSRRTGRYK